MTARLDALLLCDFAQIREGLLFIQSGGVTRLVGASFPRQFGCHVAAMVHVPPDEAVDAHHMIIKIKDATTATLVATINVDVHETARPPGLQPGEGRQVPIVVPLNQVTFHGPGQFDLQVELDDEFAGELTFRIEQYPTN